MSYNIGIHVKVEGCGKYAQIAVPEISHPTYNLGKMFRACMGWDFCTSEKDKNGEYHVCYYPCDFAIIRVKRGIRELENNGIAYEKYSSSDGWESRATAWRVLQSLKDCIQEQAEEIPIQCLYMSWGKYERSNSFFRK